MEVQEYDKKEHNLRAWPGTPAPLHTWRNFWKISAALFDVFLSILALLFVVFGILVKQANGSPVDSYATKLVSAARFVSILQTLH